MKKQLNTASIENELRGASGFFPVPAVDPHPIEPEVPKETPKVAQKVEQVSTLLSNPTSKILYHSSQKSSISRKQPLPTAEAIELMSFQLRKTAKVKINTEIDETWKRELEEIAFRLHIGKYQLLEYIVGEFLGKVQSYRGEQTVT